VTALTLRRLTEADAPAVQSLLDADPGYAVRVSGRPAQAGEASEVLTGRPPELSKDRKVALGGFVGDELVAVVDLLRGWPDPGTAHIGLLQVHVHHKGRGVGRQVHDQVVDHVRGWPEITRIRAAIVESNAPHAVPFWTAVGYAAEGEPVPYRHGAVSTTVTIWCRAV
jgi:GNAT superfamily N-acetyltransferase